MTISSFAALANGAVRQSLGAQSTRMNATLGGLASGQRILQAVTDIASLSSATSLQTETSGLRAASLNIAQADSMAQVAGIAASSIGNVLGRMQQLAVQANAGGLSDSARQGLNTEFQALRGEIDRIAQNANFNGVSLLDGSGNGEAQFQISTRSDGTVAMSIGNLTANALLGTTPLNLLTVQSAASAAQATVMAISSVTSANGEIGGFQQALGMASASLESALQNQEAAYSSLADTDVFAASAELAQLAVGRQAELASVAQTNRMGPNLIRLLIG